MTLQELLTFLKIHVDYPSFLGNLEIRNESDFCRYPMIHYFLSEDLQKNMNVAKTEYEVYEGAEFYFLFHRDEGGNFYLELKHDD